MHSLVIFLILFVFLADATKAVADDVIVQISNGKIRGLKHGNYYSFESIPYAEPPLGENRFEPPLPLKTKWLDNVKNTTEPHPACMQWDHFQFDSTDKVIGAEDCLYIDVYTPNIDHDTTKLYPVIIYIHGGAFMFGAALNGWLRHDLIMKNENAVTVFMNYRLGPLGFLSTGDTEISGNMGLKDQRLALQWIHENIRAFNGNPDEILLTGFSAGGASVHLQMLSPGLEELVSSAISFSGTALSRWVIVPHEVSIERTNKLAASVNCYYNNDTKQMKECLKMKPAEDIVRSVKEFHEFLYNPFRVFGPVVESNLTEKSFITSHPEQIIRNGQTANIPWIVSMSNDEGGYNAAELLKQNINGEHENLKIFVENFHQIAPNALFYNESITDNKFVDLYTEMLRDTYNLTTTEPINLDMYFRIQKMFTDELFHDEIYKTIRLHKDFSESAVYSYYYNNSAPYGCGNILANRTDIDFGAVHGDDVFLIFNLPKRDEYAFRPDEQIISKHLINMVVNFAITKTAPKYDDLELPKNEKNSIDWIYLSISRNNVSIANIDLF